jgi:hypothetical protein
MSAVASTVVATAQRSANEDKLTSVVKLFGGNGSWVTISGELLSTVTPSLSATNLVDEKGRSELLN